MIRNDQPRLGALYYCSCYLQSENWGFVTKNWRTQWRNFETSRRIGHQRRKNQGSEKQKWQSLAEDPRERRFHCFCLWHELTNKDMLLFMEVKRNKNALKFSWRSSVSFSRQIDCRVLRCFVFETVIIWEGTLRRQSYQISSWLTLWISALSIEEWRNSIRIIRAKHHQDASSPLSCGQLLRGIVSWKKRVRGQTQVRKN